MLHPARLRVELGEFLLRGGDDLLGAVKDDGAAARRALIEGDKVFFHGSSSVRQRAAADEFAQEGILRHEIRRDVQQLPHDLDHI